MHVANFVVHMRKAIATTAAILLTFQGAVKAQELSDFDAQVRDTLLKHPSIILEVFDLLEKQEKAAESKVNLEKITKNAKALFGDLDPSTPVLVEFLDYRCGFCKRNHAEVLQFKENNPNAIVIEKQFPILGEESVHLSRTALAVRIGYGDDAYTQVHNALLNGDRDIEADLDGYLEKMGLDLTKINELRNSEIVHNEISAVNALARRLGINATPSFVSRQDLRIGATSLQALTKMVFDIQK
jgi:protein-disulfide isomerase